MNVPFVKMQGAGNDFVLLDEWESEILPLHRKPDFAAYVCRKHFGVGADGVIFLQKSRKCDAKFSFYNPDGTTAEMDGNGIRCFAKYFHDRGYTDKLEMTAETLAGQKELHLTLFNDKVEQVRVDMGRPQIKRGEAQVFGNPEDTFISQKVDVGGIFHTITSVGMGNPHAVLFVPDVKCVDVRDIGGKIRRMRDIFPHGANVHFVQQLGKTDFLIRSYERGVEDETLACGTGICASAVAALITKRVEHSKTLSFKAMGGELSVKLDVSGDEIRQIYLIGPAAEAFVGDIWYEPLVGFEAAAYNFLSEVIPKEQ
jgi:diaminopimelate epimerase